MRFGLIFFMVVLPLLELWGLIRLGTQIGAGLTVLWVVTAAVLGVLLWRRQGTAVALDAMRRASQGQIGALAPLETMMIGFGAILLIFPGIITDFLALPLLIPPVRRFLLHRLLGRIFVMKGDASGPAAGSHASGRVIEGESRRLEDE
jgi:UPF0716 protein FxsA